METINRLPEKGDIPVDLHISGPGVLRNTEVRCRELTCSQDGWFGVFKGAQCDYSSQEDNDRKDTDSCKSNTSFIPLLPVNT